MAADGSRCVVAWLVLIVVYGHTVVTAEKNQIFQIIKLCGSPMYKNIDGAILNSENHKNLECTVTFQTVSVRQRFMLRFDEFQLDCKDHLYIYDGAYNFANYKKHLSCGNRKQDIGIIYTRTNLVTFRYMTDEWTQAGAGFKVVITAFKDSAVTCTDFKCKNNLCIDDDLVCDSINHCGDNSDETSHAMCPVNESSVNKILGVDVNVFIAIIVSIFTICFVCIVAVAICICRKQRLRQHQTPPSSNMVGSGHPSYPCGGYQSKEECIEYPESQSDLLKLQHGYPPGHGGHPEKPPPYPGNMYPPAGGIGYNVHQGNIFYPTK